MLKNISIIILSLCCACSTGVKKTGTTDSDRDTLRVMTFNMWLGGDGGGQPPEKSAEVIRVSEAKIVGMQETRSYNKGGTVFSDNALKITRNLGWNYFSQGDYGILTAYAIVDSTKNKLGIKLKIGSNRYLWVFNCHLFYIPYQPYQLAGKPYGNFPFIKTEEEAVHFAKSARGKEVDEYIREIKPILSEGWPVLLTGDFNEPSFLDWATTAAKAGLCKLKVEWPATKAFSDIGFSDAFRVMYPDEVKYPGETWSSIDAPGEIHDRIDFVFYRGKQLKVVNARTIGFKDGKSGIGVNDYPSDHRAVTVNFEWIK